MSKKQTGVIKKWQDDKGFGFIETQKGKSLFFHVSEYKPPQRPNVEDEVVFEVSQDDQGRLRALNVQELAYVRQKKVRKDKLVARKSQQQRHQQAFKTDQRKRLFTGMAFYAVLVLLAAMSKLSWIVVGWYVVLGLVTFLIYAKDKSAAQNGRWRTSESTLHALSLFGGWVGALVAQTYLRHKSKKPAFRSMYYLTVIINLALLLYILANGKASVFN